MSSPRPPAGTTPEEKAQAEKRRLEIENNMHFEAAKCGIKPFPTYVDTDNPTESNFTAATVSNKDAKLTPLLLGDKDERIIRKQPDDGSHHIRMYKGKDGSICLKALGIIKGTEGFTKAYAEMFDAAKYNGLGKPHVIFDFDSVEEVQQAHLDIALAQSRRTGVPMQFGPVVQAWLLQAAQMKAEPRKDLNGNVIFDKDGVTPLPLTKRDWYNAMAASTGEKANEEKPFAGLVKTATFEDHTKKISAQPKMDTPTKYMEDLLKQTDGTTLTGKPAADAVDAELKRLIERAKQLDAAQEELATHVDGLSEKFADKTTNDENRELVRKIFWEGEESRRALTTALQTERVEIDKRLAALQSKVAAMKGDAEAPSSAAAAAAAASPSASAPPATPTDTALVTQLNQTHLEYTKLQAKLSEGRQKAEAAAKKEAELSSVVGDKPKPDDDAKRHNISL